METLIRQAPPDHPRLLLRRGEEAELSQKVSSTPYLGAASEHVLAVAEGMLELPPVERIQTGRRLLEISRIALKRVLYLGMACRTSGDERFLRRAEEEMLAAAAFSDWNPSHFLDVAEMTAALGVGYDWLHEGLEPAARTAIRDAIVEKGLRASLSSDRWVALENNWNQVCHGGLVLGALAVMEDEPELAARIVERAVANVPRAMSTYAPDGAYPEGPTYWDYGTTYNVLLIHALESALGSDFGLARSEGFLASAGYFLHVTAPSQRFFNYSDSGLGRGVRPAAYWFAARAGDPSLLWFERPALDAFLRRRPRADGSSQRFFPMVLLWAEAAETIPEPSARHWHGGGRVPVGLHRAGWGSEDVFFGLKGGSPGASHAHMDIGSFVMEADGVRWAIDLGVQGYHDLESRGIGLWDGRQDGDRWTIFRLNNLSHNTLVVDGQLQRVSGHAPIVGFSDKAPLPHTIVDMSAVYEGQLAAAKRGMGLLPDRSVVIRDEIETLGRATNVRWGMVTGAEVTIEDQRLALLEQDGKKLTLRVESPDEARLALFDTAKPPREYDEPNPGTRMIGFELDLPAGSKEALLVVLRPEGVGDGVEPLIPLAEW